MLNAAAPCCEAARDRRRALGTEAASVETLLMRAIRARYVGSVEGAPAKVVG